MLGRGIHMGMLKMRFHMRGGACWQCPGEQEPDCHHHVENLGMLEVLEETTAIQARLVPASAPKA